MSPVDDVPEPEPAGSTSSGSDDVRLVGACVDRVGLEVGVEVGLADGVDVLVGDFVGFAVALFVGFVVADAVGVAITAPAQLTVSGRAGL